MIIGFLSQNLHRDRPKISSIIIHVTSDVKLVLTVLWLECRSHPLLLFLSPVLFSAGRRDNVLRIESIQSHRQLLVRSLTVDDVCALLTLKG